MRYGFALLASSALLLTLSASELIQPSNENEFPYIKPIAVEYLDSDRDGVVDVNDKCPDTPLGIKVDDKGCELDSDGDGVLDSKDACPNTLLGTKVDEKGCEPDTDGDGVFDSKDKCPSTPKGFKVDVNGCCLGATLNIHFQINSYAIPSGDINELKNFALFLDKNPGYKVTISGHTDSSGDEAKNKILSQNRATSVKEALVFLGIDKNRLTAIGKASTIPVADNATVEGRAQNRRIEAELIK